MIMPLNLPKVDDKHFVNLCIKHVNKGLEKGIDTVLDEYHTKENKLEYLKQFFPRGYYGDYIKDLYRLKDIITSRFLYFLGDFDKYTIMNLLNYYFQGEAREYNLGVANTLATQKKPALDDLGLDDIGKCLNYHIIPNEEDRAYILEKLAVYSSEIGASVEFLMSALEDLNQYIETCFDDTDFLNLCEFSLEELKAMSTMKEFVNMNIYVTETHLHLPYVIIK